MASVDYERVASTYQAGRSAVADEQSWGPLVAPYLPDRSPLHVLDLGTGTGIFARVWPQWGATWVVALDPALPMLGEARRTGLPDHAWAVNARGEWLPLRDGCVDAVWISAVFHHLTDRRRCVDDIARVLRGPASVVLVRSVFADRWDGGGYRVFPGIERAIGRFPALDEVTDVFTSAGFSFSGIEAVPGCQVAAATIAAWVRRMRDADTLLLGLTDEEIGVGLAELDRIGGGGVAGPTLETAVYVL